MRFCIICIAYNLSWEMVWYTGKDQQGARAIPCSKAWYPGRRGAIQRSPDSGRSEARGAVASVSGLSQVPRYSMLWGMWLASVQSCMSRPAWPSLPCCRVQDTFSCSCFSQSAVQVRTAAQLFLLRKIHFWLFV